LTLNGHFTLNSVFVEECQELFFAWISKTTPQQESRAVAKKPRDAASVLFGYRIVDNIHYKFKSSQASKSRLQGSKQTGAKSI